MREILFRGKRLEDGEWIYGYPFADTADCSLKKAGKCVCKHDGTEAYIVKWDDVYHEYNEFDVDHETVGQYTGLKDKNGTRIFEGDIIHVVTVDCSMDRYAVVKYGEFMDANYSSDDPYLGWYVEFDGIQLSVLSGKQTYRCSVSDTAEVVGNIYDNPELMEVKENG